MFTFKVAAAIIVVIFGSFSVLSGSGDSSVEEYSSPAVTSVVSGSAGVLASN